VNVGYAVAQLEKALAAAGGSASVRVQRWRAVITGLLGGFLTIGSRMPVGGAPPWVTLRVVLGGFATGGFVAGGPLHQHEKDKLTVLGRPLARAERAALNLYFAGDDGRAELASMLDAGTFRIMVPEEAALLVWAWLLEQGELDRAAALLETIISWFDRLRFYPVPHALPMRSGSGVIVATVGETARRLDATRPQEAVATMREALLVWTPLYDRAVELLLETVEGEVPSMRRDASGALVRAADGQPIVEGGWPCRTFAAGWSERARALLADYLEARELNQRSRKPEKPKESFARLRGYLATCAVDPAAMTARDVGMVRKILAAYVSRHGEPGSERLTRTRTSQRRNASAPTHSSIAKVVAGRLAAFPTDEGIVDVEPIVAPLTADEAGGLGVDQAVPIPPRVAARARRCLEAPIAELVRAGLVPSSEAMAWTLPLLTARVRAEAIANPALRRVYEGAYLAFRRRRSLLLLDLESQVRLNELPWMSAIEPWIGSDDATRDAARRTLVQTAVLAIDSFPQSILPNRLVKELRALARTAGVTIPLVDEIAADIFMGAFSGTFLRAAQVAGELLRGSVYERYYGLPYKRVAALDDVQKARFGAPTSAGFASLCQELAGDRDRSHPPVARYGMVIEQEQILTTHNLAGLWQALDLDEVLRPRLPGIALRCFQWICKRQQMVIRLPRARLQAIKNSAYAWRQMLFFLSMMDAAQVAELRGHLGRHFAGQSPAFQETFGPAVAGLQAVLDGDGFDSNGWHATSGGRRFTGWAVTNHWLLDREAARP
jgi:hypothetical protein